MPVIYLINTIFYFFAFFEKVCVSCWSMTNKNKHTKSNGATLMSINAATYKMIQNVITFKILQVL